MEVRRGGGQGGQALRLSTLSTACGEGVIRQEKARLPFLSIRFGNELRSLLPRETHAMHRVLTIPSRR